MLAAIRQLEFDRVVAVLADLAITPAGRDRLEALAPAADPSVVRRLLATTSEGVRFHASHRGFPLRAPEDLASTLDALDVVGRPLEPLRLLGLADHLDSIEETRRAILATGDAFPLLKGIALGASAFRDEIARVRRAIDPGGDVADHASPALAAIRERLRRQRSRLRTTLEGFLRGRDTSRYLQDQVVTDRNGRFVLPVRAEHRQSIPGIVHGASTTGATLFLEPLATVEINNDIVAGQEEEIEEVRRILLELTDAFRARPDDLAATLEAATALDVIQAKARLSGRMRGLEPALSQDGTWTLVAARHPLLIEQGITPVPVDVTLEPPARVLVITGPNTGGKTVALKTAGLLSVMAQSGLHVPAAEGTTLPVFRTIFADIGDSQSIAASLSTFSAYITNVVTIDRQLDTPALVLLDEVGAGTDPAEGGALGTAVIDHFRQRGAYVIATTHDDVIKTYASTTDGVISAGFSFNPETFAPTYRLVYGSPGRSIALEIAARLGMPPAVIAAARGRLSHRERDLADHLAKIDRDLHQIEQDRARLDQERSVLASRERSLRSKEAALAEREATFRTRVNDRVDERVREARKEIDAVVDALKAHSAALRTQAGGLVTPKLTTGDAGLVRAEARAAVDEIAAAVRGSAGRAPAAPPDAAGHRAAPLVAGARVTVAGLGLEGIVASIANNQVDVDVHGKRMRVAKTDVRVLAGPVATSGTVALRVDLAPRDAQPAELNVIGLTVDEALTKLERFLDDVTTSEHQAVRVVHGFGTGQLRRAVGAFLREHPLVARVEQAPANQGGGGATVAELKD
ncbi:MAG: endonuclease MutS2 [Vicinamibacterales bacterium]